MGPNRELLFSRGRPSSGQPWYAATSVCSHVACDSSNACSHVACDISRGRQSCCMRHLRSGHAALVCSVHEGADGQAQLPLLVTLHNTTCCHIGSEQQEGGAMGQRGESISKPRFICLVFCTISHAIEGEKSGNGKGGGGGGGVKREKEHANEVQPCTQAYSDACDTTATHMLWHCHRFTIALAQI